MANLIKIEPDEKIETVKNDFNQLLRYFSGEEAIPSTGFGQAERKKSSRLSSYDVSLKKSVKIETTVEQPTTPTPPTPSTSEGNFRICVF